jgi:cyclopropane fatty-acyl-phospholipid synthase-like methyltransferase
MRFDKIFHVSPLLTSTIGYKNYPDYSLSMARLLKTGGFLLTQLHVCTRWDPETVQWFLYQDHYILPGADGCLSSLHAYGAAMEAAGLHVLLVDRIDAVYTWEAWLHRWNRNRPIIRKVYGEQK